MSITRGNIEHDFDIVFSMKEKFLTNKEADNVRIALIGG
jgi:hypothetical protein